MVKKIKDEYMNFLTIPSFTQSAADVFTDSPAVLTGCNIRGHLAMKIHAVELFWVPASFVNSSWVEVSLKTLSGLRGLDDPSVIVLQEMMCRFITSGGGWQHMGPMITKFDPPILFAGEKLYAALNSNATAVANACIARVWFTWVTITDAEYIEALETFR